jgi:hypothetical protein
VEAMSLASLVKWVPCWTNQSNYASPTVLKTWHMNLSQVNANNVSLTNGIMPRNKRVKSVLLIAALVTITRRGKH